MSEFSNNIVNALSVDLCISKNGNEIVIKRDGFFLLLPFSRKDIYSHDGLADVHMHISGPAPMLYNMILTCAICATCISFWTPISIVYLTLLGSPLLLYGFGLKFTRIIFIFNSGNNIEVSANLSKRSICQLQESIVRTLSIDVKKIF